jgi:hypothetical protein
VISVGFLTAGFAATAMVYPLSICVKVRRA